MTTMAEPTTSTQMYAVFIRATPEQVWDGITKPEFTARYFYGSVMDCTWEPGAELAGWAEDRSAQYVDGEILESDKPRKLVYTWRALYDADMAAEPHSRVTWELEPAGEHVTKLTVTHDRLDASPKTALSVAGGWSYVLSGLKTLLETGEPLEN